MALATAVDSKICAWGNSSALRLPKSVLQAAKLSAGDEVNVCVNDAGNIEIVPKQQAHRRVKPQKGITFDSLFAHYIAPKEALVAQAPEETAAAQAHGTSMMQMLEASAAQAPAWPNEDMVGAELDAWCS